MEEYEKQIMLKDCPRKLDFDAPLLSTRRPFRIMLPANPDNKSRDTHNGVPFSWERIPGEPKDMETRDDKNDIDAPLPKLPPGKWQPPQEDTSYEDGCDGDVDDDYDNRDNYNKKDCFSDAIDIFSLADSIEEDKDKSEDNVAVSIGRNSAVEVEEPNFIIQRFLPDAQALAAASVVHNKVATYPSVSRAVSVRRAYPSPKGCGLGTLFRWGLKPKLCSVKSPVQGKSVRVLNSQWRSKPKQNN